jgi:hypothetical protein
MQLVKYDTAYEQLEVENAIVPSAAVYLIGLNYASGQWAWQDGTVLGSGVVPSNEAPYAHWAQAANNSFSNFPIYTAVRASPSAGYGPYTGDGSTAQQVASYYTTTAANKTNGWLPTTTSTTNPYVCAGLESTLYPCPPPAPPPVPPPVPPSPPPPAARGSFPPPAATGSVCELCGNDACNAILHTSAASVCSSGGAASSGGGGRGGGVVATAEDRDVVT